MSLDVLNSLLSNAGTIALVALFFGGSILVHELGHFWAARRRGVKVERFSIGFGPKIVSWRGKDGVEYRLSWIPLGGYVALPQLADMSAIEGESSMDVAAMSPISYVTKLIVFAAGAAMNLVFAFALACIIWLIGQPTSREMGTTRIGFVSPTIELIDGTKVVSPALLAGLQAGDVVKAIDGQSISDWGELMQALVTGSGRTADGSPQAVFTIERGGKRIDVTTHPRLGGEEGFRRVGIAPGYELIVHGVNAGSPGEKAGFRPGDEILSMDDRAIMGISAYQDYLEQHAKQTIRVLVKREGRVVELVLSPRPNGKTSLDLVLTTGFQLTHPSPFAQLWEHTVVTFRTLWSLVNPRSDIGFSKVTGPAGIFRIFYSAAEAGIRAVLMFTILINVNLAIFNLLPIPVLDGGHILFATIARIRGRALPTDWVMTVQSVFMVLLFSMIIYVSVFDVRRIVRDFQSARSPAAAPAK